VRQLCTNVVREERRRIGTGIVEALQTDVIPPALEKRETNLLIGECAPQEGQIVTDDLLLQVDRICRDDGPIAVQGRPAQRGKQISERLPDSCSGFENTNPLIVVQLHDAPRQRELAGAHLVFVERTSDAPIGGQVAQYLLRIEILVLARARHLHNYIDVPGGIIADGEAHSV